MFGRVLRKPALLASLPKPVPVFALRVTIRRAGGADGLRRRHVGLAGQLACRA